MKPYIIGIDVGGTSIKIGIFKVGGSTEELLEKWEIPTRTEENGKYILSDIAFSIRENLKKQGIQIDQIEGVGMAVPGAVLPDGTVNRCVNLGWGIVKAADELSEILDGIRVKVCNDGNAAALGEMWKGGGQGYKNVVMVTLGTGIGGGIVLDGKTLAGAFGAAGEIGHLHVDPDETVICGCGKKGHLEQYCSASGVASMARKYLASCDEDTYLRKFENPTSKNLFDGAKAGDAVCLRLVDEFGSTLGRGLAMVSCVVDPEIYVIGGGLSKAGQIVIDIIQNKYRSYAFHASEPTKFALAKLGNDAGIYGCVKMIIDG